MRLVLLASLDQRANKENRVLLVQKETKERRYQTKQKLTQVKNSHWQRPFMQSLKGP